MQLDSTHSLSPSVRSTFRTHGNAKPNTDVQHCEHIHNKYSSCYWQRENKTSALYYYFNWRKFSVATFSACILVQCVQPLGLMAQLGKIKCILIRKNEWRQPKYSEEHLFECYFNFYRIIFSEDTGHIYTIYCSNYNELSVEMDQCMKWICNIRSVMFHLIHDYDSEELYNVTSIMAEFLPAIQ